jgi:SAM-dependent methyltransferase
MRSLLDVGCGDGAFLAEARDCGWQVVGLEPDHRAAAVARQRGLEVRVGGLECLQAQTGAFDVITLSHVIEHLPRPVQALRDCRRLLKPGGQLWLETPNVDSLGHQVFGENWRGLEAPRHFVLFSPRALERALAAAGFGPPRSMPAPSPRRWIFERSLAISQGRLPDDVLPLPWSVLWRVMRADLRERPESRTREFLPVVAACD